jgi:hypothetical protein
MHLICGLRIVGLGEDDQQNININFEEYYTNLELDRNERNNNKIFN